MHLVLVQLHILFLNIMLSFKKKKTVIEKVYTVKFRILRFPSLPPDSDEHYYIRLSQSLLWDSSF